MPGFWHCKGERGDKNDYQVSGLPKWMNDEALA